MKYVFFALIAIYPFITYAKQHVVETPGGKMIFTTDSKEKSQRAFFGADLWFTGATAKNKRNVMSIKYNSKDIELDNYVSPEAYKKHKKEMRAFGKEQNYTNIKFDDREFVKINDSTSYQLFSWSFSKDGLNFKERSYYVTCGPIFFIAKATTFVETQKDQLKFKNIIESVQCKK